MDCLVVLLLHCLSACPTLPAIRSNCLVDSMSMNGMSGDSADQQRETKRGSASNQNELVASGGHIGILPRMKKPATRTGRVVIIWRAGIQWGGSGRGSSCTGRLSSGKIIL